MKKLRSFLVCMLLALTVMPSCRREPIEYPVSNYYISFDFAGVDVEVDDDTAINKIYAVVFFEKGTGRYVYSTYIRPFNHPSSMPVGGYVDGIEPGDYTVIVYGFDSKTVRVNNETSFKSIYADTDKYGYSEKVPVMYMPDGMMYDCLDVSVPYVTDTDKTYIIKTHPSDVCSGKRINIFGVTNLERAESVTLYVSGQCPGLMMGGGLVKVEGNAIVLFDGRVAGLESLTKADVEIDMSKPHIEGDLVTFGRSTGGENVILTVFVTAVGGRVSWAQVDVTDLMAASEEEGTDHIDVIVELDVYERNDGGFDPKADPWKDDVTEIDLQ